MPAATATLLLASILLLALPVVEAAEAPKATFREIVVPANTASEPTIGIPWSTDSVFFQSNTKTFRARFDPMGKEAWTDVTPVYQSPINLDPMLIADSDEGRVFAGGLAGPCSIMMLSDDDGQTWTPAGNMCSGANFDHQSIGVGKPVGPVPHVDPYPNIAYYCAQGGTITCTRSVDGGRTWAPFQDTPGPCEGFNGHIRSSPKTGFVAVPVAQCGQQHGYLSTSDGGLTWRSNLVPAQENWTNGFDPSLQFTRPSGWMYYAMASERGVHVALTKDEGRTWEKLGGGHGQSTDWLDLGALHNPPIVSGVFTNVQAGDDDRVAVAFFGLEARPGADVAFLKSNSIYRCDKRQDELVWRAYMALSYDAGQTWSVERVSDDPVQVGGIYDSVVGGGGGCRNLLDFNDMDIDSKGRIYWGIGDGCIDECANNPAPNVTGWRRDAPRLWRQESGLGLFAKYDGAPGAPGTQPHGGTGTGSPLRRDNGGTPTLGVVATLSVLVAALILRRRR